MLLYIPAAGSAFFRPAGTGTGSGMMTAAQNQTGSACTKGNLCVLCVIIVLSSCNSSTLSMFKTCPQPGVDVRAGTLQTIMFLGRLASSPCGTRLLLPAATIHYSSPTTALQLVPHIVVLTSVCVLVLLRYPFPCRTFLATVYVPGTWYDTTIIDTCR